MDGFKITQQLVFSCLNFPYFFFGFVNYNSFINIEVQPFLKNWYLKSKYFSFSWSSSNAGKGEHFPCRCRRHANRYRVRFCQSYRDLIHVKTEAAKCQTLEWSITGVVFIHCKITIISINQQLAAIHKKAVAGAIDAESLSFHQQSYHTLWTDSSQTMAYHFPKLHPVFFLHFFIQVESSQRWSASKPCWRGVWWIPWTCSTICCKGSAQFSVVQHQLQGHEVFLFNGHINKEPKLRCRLCWTPQTLFCLYENVGANF